MKRGVKRKFNFFVILLVVALVFFIALFISITPTGKAIEGFPSINVIDNDKLISDAFINPGLRGDALVFPLWTVDDRLSVFSITNTDSNYGVIIKIVFEAGDFHDEENGNRLHKEMYWYLPALGKSKFSLTPGLGENAILEELFASEKGGKVVKSAIKNEEGEIIGFELESFNEFFSEIMDKTLNAEYGSITILAIEKVPGSFNAGGETITINRLDEIDRTATNEIMGEMQLREWGDVGVNYFSVGGPGGGGFGGGSGDGGAGGGGGGDGNGSGGEGAGSTTFGGGRISQKTCNALKQYCAANLNGFLSSKSCGAIKRYCENLYETQSTTQPTVVSPIETQSTIPVGTTSDTHMLSVESDCGQTVSADSTLTTEISNCDLNNVEISVFVPAEYPLPFDSIPFTQSKQIYCGDITYSLITNDPEAITTSCISGGDLEITRTTLDGNLLNTNPTIQPSSMTLGTPTITVGNLFPLFLTGQFIQNLNPINFEGKAFYSTLTMAKEVPKQNTELIAYYKAEAISNFYIKGSLLDDSNLDFCLENQLKQTSAEDYCEPFLFNIYDSEEHKPDNQRIVDILSKEKQFYIWEAPQGRNKHYKTIHFFNPINPEEELSSVAHAPRQISIQVRENISIRGLSDKKDIKFTGDIKVSGKGWFNVDVLEDVPASSVSEQRIQTINPLKTLSSIFHVNYPTKEERNVLHLNPGRVGDALLCAYWDIREDKKTEIKIVNSDLENIIYKLRLRNEDGETTFESDFWISSEGIHEIELSSLENGINIALKENSKRIINCGENLCEYNSDGFNIKSIDKFGFIEIIGVASAVETNPQIDISDKGDVPNSLFAEVVIKRELPEYFVECTDQKIIPVNLQGNPVDISVQSVCGENAAVIILLGEFPGTIPISDVCQEEEDCNEGSIVCSESGITYNIFTPSDLNLIAASSPCDDEEIIMVIEGANTEIYPREELRIAYQCDALANFNSEAFDVCISSDNEFCGPNLGDSDKGEDNVRMVLSKRILQYPLVTSEEESTFLILAMPFKNEGNILFTETRVNMEGKTDSENGLFGKQFIMHGVLDSPTTEEGSIRGWGQLATDEKYVVAGSWDFIENTKISKYTGVPIIGFALIKEGGNTIYSTVPLSYQMDLEEEIDYVEAPPVRKTDPISGIPEGTIIRLNPNIPITVTSDPGTAFVEPDAETPLIEILEIGEDYVVVKILGETFTIKKGEVKQISAGGRFFRVELVDIVNGEAQISITEIDKLDKEDYRSIWFWLLLLLLLILFIGFLIWLFFKIKKKIEEKNKGVLSGENISTIPPTTPVAQLEVDG